MLYGYRKPPLAQQVSMIPRSAIALKLFAPTLARELLILI